MCPHQADLAAEEGELLDEEINEMLARNEEELALFARMDEQRKKDDKQWQSPCVALFVSFLFYSAFNSLSHSPHAQRRKEYNRCTFFFFSFCFLRKENA